MKKHPFVLTSFVLAGAIFVPLAAQMAHAESFTLTQPLSRTTNSQQSASGSQQTGKTLGNTQQINNDNFNFVIANPNTIDPKKFIFEVKPGQTARDSVLVKNSSGVPLKFNLYGADETRSAQGSFAIKTKNEEAKTIGKWITFDEKEFTLAAGETKKVNFTLSVAEGTPEGTYSGGLAAEKTSADTKNPNVIIAVRIGLRVDVKVTSNPQPVPKKYSGIAENPLFQVYFLASAALFIGSAVLLGWTYLKNKKGSRRAPNRKK